MHICHEYYDKNFCSYRIYSIVGRSL